MKQTRWTVNYTRQANHPEHVEVLALTAEIAAEHARTHVAANPAITVTSVEPAPRRARRPRPAPAAQAAAPMFEVVAELDAFAVWQLTNGELVTEHVDGAEALPEPATIAEYAFAVEHAGAAQFGRLF